MRLDKLQLDLRPRPNAQALDLGLMLLRSDIGDVYKAWLALWLPLVALCGVLAWYFPGYAGAWWMLAWWLRPLLERAPLYILSRQVFGETVTWKDALRAWPGQLRGGWFRLLTWWRPTMPGRGLYQAIWQLEGARGTVAAERRKVIGNNKTARSAFWFGTVCANFEMILQIGLIAFIGIFLSSEDAINPFAYLFGKGNTMSPQLVAISYASYGFAAGIIGPVYTACCFTLYLNRRATLEAWDIEIMLRQITPPAARKPFAAAAVALLAPFMLALAVFQPMHADAADATAVPRAQPTCAPPKWMTERTAKQVELRGPDQNAEQTRMRHEVAELFASEELRGYVCEERWQSKNPPKTPKELNGPQMDLSVLAGILKILLIATAIGLVAWLLYRYRDKFPSLARRPAPRRATEIRGLDIRPETLPDDVAAAVRKLWDQGRHRAALALLYRATLSRLVHEHDLRITQGATEGDCLREANRAHAAKRLGDDKLSITTSATDLWLNGAYGNRWPETGIVVAMCAEWQTCFHKAKTSERVPS
jgi:hypothetical protein